jgi:hypothetical protein
MDITATCEAKSDQLNTDDLIAGPRTIKITKVAAGSTEQPVAVSFEGDQAKPWYPCKSMRRVLVAAWGADASRYVGRRVTLFRDPSVKYGGIQVGGIRISHLSDLDSPLSIALTVTRQKRTPYKVQPLAAAPAVGDSVLVTYRGQDLEVVAENACRASGLTDQGICRLAYALSKGETELLNELPQNILARLAKSGVRPETVDRCNAPAPSDPNPTNPTICLLPGLDLIP